MKNKSFRVGDLFDIHPTKSYKYTNSKLLSQNGKTPVVANTSVNNGICGYSIYEPTEKGGIITFSDTTTADAIFFQDVDFIGYSHVQGMYPFSDLWNEDSLMYFMTVFKKAALSYGFNYGNKFNRRIAADIIVDLPVTHTDDLDFNYMEKYIFELKEKNKKIVNNFFVNNFLDKNEKVCEEKILFKKIKLSELFESQNGDVDIQQKHINNKGYKVVSSGELNYGIIGESDLKSKVIEGNSLTIDMFGNVFYREFDYKMVTHARVFSLKCKYDISRESYLYLASLLFYLKNIYSYNNMCSWNKIKDDYISIPYENEFSISFDYMESFIKGVENKLAERVYL